MKAEIEIPKGWIRVELDDILQVEDHYLMLTKSLLVWERISRRQWGYAARVIGTIVIRKSN
jgi:hypothetical protein